ncbi:MAG: AraC family transcriptional regulator [Opitutales bacterium]|nr:AraC family transcriptional regulator [Opitutales bacterium]
MSDGKSGRNWLKFRRCFSDNHRAEMHGLLEECVQRSTKGLLRTKVAQESSSFEKHPLMHYHFSPEVFVQQEGVTEFSFPRDKLVLKPGEVCILPAGVPHKERISKIDGQFRNMVVGFYHDTISVHFANEVSPGKPDIEVIEFFFAPDIDQMKALMNILVQVSKTGDSQERDAAMRGLVMAFFSLLYKLVAHGTENFNSEAGKVFQTKWLVREQLSSTTLSVKSLAERLQCSADYLSHLFHSTTGERLVSYIQRKRIEGAKLALEATPLYVSEIAWSSGFSDPAYFARVFKKFTGETPQSYREMLEKKRHQMDSRPKTVYHDRDEFSMGKPHVMNETLAN